MNEVNGTPPLSQKHAFYYLTQQQINKDSDSDFDISNDFIISQHSRALKTTNNCQHRGKNYKQIKQHTSFSDISQSNSINNNHTNINNEESKILGELPNIEKPSKSHGSTSSSSKESKIKDQKLPLDNDINNYELVIPPQSKSLNCSPEKKNNISWIKYDEKSSIGSTPINKKVHKLIIDDDLEEEQHDGNKIKHIQNESNKIRQQIIKQLEDKQDTKDNCQLNKNYSPCNKRKILTITQSCSDSDQQSPQKENYDKNVYKSLNEGKKIQVYQQLSNIEESEELMILNQPNNKKRKKKLTLEDEDDEYDQQNQYQELNLFSRKKVRQSNNQNNINNKNNLASLPQQPQQSSEKRQSANNYTSDINQLQLFKLPYNNQHNSNNITPSNNKNECSNQKLSNTHQKDIIYTQVNNLKPFKRLKKLQKGRHLSQNSNAENLCSICLDIPKDNICGILQCKHKFCAQCILDWAEVTNLCPNCRKEFVQIQKIDFNNPNDCAQIIPVEKKKQRVHNEEGEYDDDEDDDVNDFIDDDLMDDTCYICKKDDNSGLMLICDDCNIHICHTYCDNSIIDGLIPEGDWLCHYCRENDSNSEWDI